MLEKSVTKMEIPNYFLVEERIKTFKNWPFSDKNKCNVRNMAEAGFYSVATCKDDADAAKCFLCGKELDGWEASDDPWAEHKSHAAKCAFVQIGKKEDDLLVRSLSPPKTHHFISSIRMMRHCTLIPH